MTLTVGSLFSGIGGLDLGLERAGMVVKWQVEKDPYARRVLAKHWPEVPCFDDVVEFRRNLESGFWRGLNVDVLCGGFPCQDISVAGKGAGIKEGTRSGLWIEFARLIRELRPRYVLVENVPALRSRGLDRVLGDLAACGYDAEWDGLSASAVGAPHRRDRLFVVAYARSTGLEGLGAAGATGHGRGQGPVADADQPGRLRADVPNERGANVSVPAGGGAGAGRPDRRVFGAGALEGTQGDWWTSEPDVGRVAHGVPKRVDRLRCLGNAVVPQVAEFVGRLILAHAGLSPRPKSVKVSSASATGFEGAD